MYCLRRKVPVNVLDFVKLNIYVVICSVTTKSNERLYNSPTNREGEIQHFKKILSLEEGTKGKKKENRWDNWKVFSKMGYLNSNRSITAFKIN